MKNKGIIIELTALLDVILIMLFWVMLNMDRETEKIKTDAAEKAAEYNRSVSAMSEELETAKEQYNDAKARCEDIQAEFDRYIEENPADMDEAVSKALEMLTTGEAVTINLVNGEYLIYYDSDVLGRADPVATSSDISGSIVAALNKAGIGRDDVISCAFVYGRNSRINDIERMRAAEEKISSLYDNFYCSYIKVPY